MTMTINNAEHLVTSKQNDFFDLKQTKNKLWENTEGDELMTMINIKKT